MFTKLLLIKNQKFRIFFKELLIEFILVQLHGDSPAKLGTKMDADRCEN